MQLIFGLPILYFAISCIILDSMGVINVEKFGYAFFGGIILLLLNYFFRKAAPPENEVK